jgi:hypothetical protein
VPLTADLAARQRLADGRRDFQPADSNQSHLSFNCN